MSADDTLAFLAVAQCGGFTAAASRLNQPKSTLVRRVRVLETSLGVRLFDRATRSLSLTEAGHVYRDRLGEWGRILDEAGQAVTELRGQASGWLPQIDASSGSKWWHHQWGSGVEHLRVEAPEFGKVADPLSTIRAAANETGSASTCKVS